MFAEKKYKLYLHKRNGRYITVRTLSRIVELFPESGHGIRRRTLLEPDQADKLLKSYDFTGVVLPHGNVFLPGAFFVRPAGGLFLSLDLAGGDCCFGLDAHTGCASIGPASITGLLDEIAEGKLECARDEEEAGAAAPEPGRYYFAGDCVFTIFRGTRSGMYELHPENGWHPFAVSVDKTAVHRALDCGAIRPVEGRLFKSAGPGQLLPVLAKYSTFENLETGQIVQISKVSKYLRAVQSSCGLSYNALITQVCTKKLVPHTSMNF